MYHFDKEAMMYVETGYGFNPNNSTVNEVKGIDSYNRLIMGAMVFRGTWEECMEFVEQVKQRKEN